MTPIDEIAKATRLVREGRLSEATTLLSGGAAPARRPKGSGRPRSGLADTLRGLAGEAGAARPRARAPSVPDGARWERREHRGPAGARPYALYVPSRPAPCPALVLMLHGCTQDAGDFACGTRMNEHAERGGFLVAYPEQPRAENQNGCWNWFEPRHQGLDHPGGGGETAILAGVAAEIIAEHGAGPARVFAAGLSAGGAAAANLANAYPDLLAGVCVHSGLPARAARGLPDALSAMRQGAATFATNAAPVPMLVIHGDADRTVSVANADGLERQALGPAASTVQAREEGRANGMAFTRTTDALADGTVLCERITVHGGGHAWFGGDPAGSHTEARGPDASAEAARFFGLPA